jgi:hypothetical protein
VARKTHLSLVPLEPRQAPTPSPGPTPGTKAPPRGARCVPRGVLGTCSECRTLIPSTNTTGVCVKCTLAHETLAESLARWDAIIAEQQRIQRQWGVTPADLREAARALDALTPDELEEE